MLSRITPATLPLEVPRAPASAGSLPQSGSPPGCLHTSSSFSSQHPSSPAPPVLMVSLWVVCGERQCGQCTEHTLWLRGRVQISARQVSNCRSLRHLLNYSEAVRWRVKFPSRGFWEVTRGALVLEGLLCKVRDNVYPMDDGAPPQVFLSANHMVKSAFYRE